MKSTAQKTRPKQTRAKAAAHDERLLKRARQEDREGAPRKYPEPSPEQQREFLARDLRDMAERLLGVTTSIIEAYTGEDGVFAHDAFAEALRVVNDVRVCLEYQAEGLQKGSGSEVAA